MKLEPGDVIDLIKKLRRLMQECDTLGYTLEAELKELEPDPEKLEALQFAAAQTRRAAKMTAERSVQFLERLEHTDAYQRQRIARLHDKLGKEPST